MKDFFNRNISKFVSLLLLYEGLKLLFELPFLNSFLDIKNIFALLWFVCVIIFGIPVVVSASLGILSLIIAVIFLQFGVYGSALLAGEATYLLFVISVFQQFLLLRWKK